MKMGLLRNIPIAIASLLASSTAFAAMDMDSRVSELENQMQQVRTETAMGTYGAQTATARPEVDGHGWYLSLDILYWHAKVGGTEFAYTDNNASATMPIKGRTKDIDFSWDWGFRAGVGYNFEHDAWDANAQYTLFNSNASDSTSAGLNSSVVPLRGSSQIVSTTGNLHDLFTFCTSAKSQFAFTFQSVDLELGRAYFVSGNLSFRPHWGVETAWFDLKQTVRYTGGTAVANNVGNGNNLGLGLNTVHVKDNSDFWGLGPRAGVQSQWHLGYGFSIFGNVAGALLFGYFDVDHRERFTGDANNRVNLHANRHAFSPAVQYQLGLRYDQYLHNNKQHIGIGLGFEGQYWWRMNQMLKIDDEAVLKYERYSEDVNMYGLTLDIKFDF